MLNVSPRSVDRAKVVRDKGVPELQQKVASGDVAPSTAAEIATLPKEEQEEIVARGENKILKAAKQIRGSCATARHRAQQGVTITPADAGNEGEADAIAIQVRAEIRLAEEYDAAQERGEAIGRGRPKIADASRDLITPKVIGGRDALGEARQLRDAEAAAVLPLTIHDGHGAIVERLKVKMPPRALLLRTTAAAEKQRVGASLLLSRRMAGIR